MDANEDEHDKVITQLIRIEEVVDSKLNELIKFNKDLLKSHTSISVAETEINQLNLETIELFEKLGKLLEQLSINSNRPNQQLIYDRHQSIHSNYKSEFNRISTALTNSINSANLLSSVRNDIDAYKLSHQSDTDMLLAERGKLDNSHSILDSSLSQAFETRADFSNQGASLKSISLRLKSSMHSIPGVNSLLTLISARRKRDSIILGLLIAFCIIIIFNYI